MLSESNHIRQNISGTPGLLLAISAWLIMAGMAYGFDPATPLESEYGICLESVRGWQMPHFLSWAINIIACGLSALLALWLNKEFRFIHDNTKLFASVFLFTTATNPWLTHQLGAPVFFTIMSLTALVSLFAHYGERNASTGVFIAFSTLSVGSLFQHSFLLMMPAFVVAVGLLNMLRIREICAVMLGIIAPYWIALGFGVISLDDFRWPDPESIFFADNLTNIPVWTMLNVALTAVAILLLSLSNAIKVFSTNSRIRAFNSTFYLLSLALMICVIVDFENSATYLPMLNLMLGIQVTHFLIINQIRRPMIFIGVAMSIYTFLLCMSLYV